MSGADASRPLLPSTEHHVRRWTVPGIPRLDGTGVDLPVAAIGRAEAPAVVLAHGVGSSARFLAAAAADPVVEAGHRLVVVDQRGHGDATACPDPDDHALDAYAADLAAVVASVPGPVAAVGGVSLGGHAAVRAALDVPRLLALPAWTGRRVAGEGPHAAIAAEVRATGVAALTDRLRDDAALPGWLRTTLVTDYDRHDPGSLAAALLALDGADGPTEAQVAALRAPAGPGCTLVAWPDDPGHPLEVAQRWARLADAPLTTLDLHDPDERLTRFGDALVAALVALPATWPAWATAPIEVVAADPAWPRHAEVLIDALRGLPALARAPVAHVGSTAVPGLAAKPTIDLLAQVAADDVAVVVAALAADGWARIPSGSSPRSRWCSLALPDGARRRAHLHLLAPDDPAWGEHLAFRDALRADPLLARRYAALKAELATRHRGDREAYTDAKATFVRGVLAP